jgi:hypothetical protein
MASCLHDVVVVTSQDCDTSPRLPIPNPDSLIIRSRDNPGVLAMEEDSSDVVEIYQASAPASLFSHTGPSSTTVNRKTHPLTASQGEQAFPLLVVPNFDLVVVSSRTEYWLSRMKADTSDGTWISAGVCPFDVIHRANDLPSCSS